jgi:tRNA pseudouridine55 synthase
VRALAEAFGERLGAGAHLSALRRTRAGDFGLGRAVTLDELRSRVEAGAEVLLPLEAALPRMPAAHLTGEEARRERHGAAVAARGAGGLGDGAHVAMFEAGVGLLAVGSYEAARGLLRPRVMLAAEEK